MQEILPYLLHQLKRMNLRYEVHSFDSGCKMVDIWIQDKFYCIQIEPEMIGLSLITEENISFDTIPNSIYTSIEDFKTEFEKIVK